MSESKAWIYRGHVCECESHYWLGQRKPHVHSGEHVARLEPIPDDVVLVPREMIEAARKFRNSITATKITGESASRLCEVFDAILACVEPEKPKDERAAAVAELLEAAKAGHERFMATYRRVARELEGRDG